MGQQSIIPFPLQALQNKNSHYINTSETTVRTHDVFIDTDIEGPSEYRELISLLFNAGENEIINIFINSGGGQLDTALSIVEGLKNTNAHVTAFIMGACHSAASIIMMYCHTVVVLDNAYSMIHTASFGSSGNTSNVKNHTEFTVKQVEKLLNETYEGFLSKEELVMVKQGVELWFDSEAIKTRMTKRIKFLESKQRKESKSEKTEGDKE